MTTSVVINGYEIQNWHTVSILELYRARKTQERGRESARPAPVKKSEKKTRRSRDMSKKVEINDELVRSWVIANKRDGISVASLSRDSGVSHYVITRRITEYLEDNPDFAVKLDQRKLPKMPNSVTKVTRSEPPHLADLIAEAAAQMDDPAADDPTPAAPPTRPAPMVIRVEELETRPRLPYAPPAIVREGSLKPVTIMPEVKTMRVNTLEQLPRLADFLRDLRGIEGIQIAGSISVALSIEAEL